MKYKEAVEELFRRRTKGVKLGLERVISTLERLGSPQRSFRSIHIAGTNGKGSVSRIVYELLRAHGLSTGLFTSPHLVRFTERIVVDDSEIGEEEVIRLIEELKPYCEELTFFEYVTVMAFKYFEEKGVEYAVLETGLGGRLDATNVVVPEVSVITKIGFDHQEFLGNTLQEIAGEKAGIVKRGVPVVTASQEREAEEVILEKARQNGAEIFIYGRDFYGKLKEMSLNGVVFDFYSSGMDKISGLHLPLNGFYQVENASVAIRAFMRVFPDWDEAKVREALRRVRFPGRLEVLSKEPLIIFDIAHNPQAATALVSSLKKLTDKKPILVFGVMKDKDALGILKSFEGYADRVIFAEPSYERRLDFEEFVRRFNGLRLKVTKATNSLEAFYEANEECKKNPNLFVLCTGSAYLVGELKELLGERAVLRELGELL